MAHWTARTNTSCRHRDSIETYWPTAYWRSGSSCGRSDTHRCDRRAEQLQGPGVVAAPE
uniref:Uncharacterized protein n=1 Tax=Hyaloperonospora arabidopsidis (strain Emoy2) TaxID=559515 RepID=M4BQL9_HYAAE